jgi:DNA-binding MarR family transcriptional regulator
MLKSTPFDLKDFLPYLLAQAAEQASVEFQYFYKTKYGMLRTEWRVLFHLGRYGDMTAKDICDRARLHKTKVSRAVSALQEKRFLTRAQQEKDRRHETLCLTRSGQRAYTDLSNSAQRFDSKMIADFTDQEAEILRRCLIRIADL